MSSANLNGAKIGHVDLNGVAFNLEPGSIPLIPSFATVKNLDKLLYVDPPHSLVEIRNGLKEAGMREEERILNYVIKHGAMETAWRRGGLMEKVEAFFSWLLFDFTTKWGMAPGRPLGFLGWVMLALAPIYSVVATRKRGKGRIWKVLDPARLDKPNDEIDSFPLSVGFFKAIWIGLYFSLLSAFRIGWREINVGNWISRLQPQEYTLQATGWVRVVCGLQSLLSVFFIALWALTYFGRPFE